MIAERQLEKSQSKTVHMSARPNSLRLLLFLLWGFTLIGIIQPQTVSRAAADALVFCGMKLIPSLFPLAAAGSLLAKAGISRRLSRLIGRIMRPMGLSPASGVCLLMGLFAGFPTGAIIATSLVESGQIDSEEASRLCCFTNNASAAFLVGTVGSGLFGDSRIGWLLWTAQTLAALTVGLFMGRSAIKARRGTDREECDPDLSRPPFDFGTVSRAIASSAQGMLSLTAFVVFFAAFTAVAGEGIDVLTGRLDAQTVGVIKTAVGGLLEISGGLRNAAELALPKFAKVMLASLVTGWSGLSVYMQVLSAAKGLSQAHTAALPKRLAKAKVASAALTMVYAAVMYGVFVR